MWKWRDLSTYRMLGSTLFSQVTQQALLLSWIFKSSNAATAGAANTNMNHGAATVILGPILKVAVRFSSSVPVGGPSSHLRGWPLLFIRRPFIRRTKVGFHLGSGNPRTACMVIILLSVWCLFSNLTDLKESQIMSLAALLSFYLIIQA